MALMEVGRPCGNEETYLLERGRKRDAQVRKRHTVEMLRNKYKLDGGQEAALSLVLTVVLEGSTSLWGVSNLG